MENSDRKGIPGRNGGTLLAGGMPGNKGGGRPKDEIRALCASNLSKAAELIQKQLDENPDLTIEQVIKAAEVSGKYSIGTKSEVEIQLDEGGIKLFGIACDIAEEMGLNRVEFIDRVEARMK